MPQAIAHRAQFADRLVELVGLGGEHLPIDAWPPVRREHAGDLVERKAGGLAKRDQGQPLEHPGIEQTTLAAPAGGNDQPFFRVVAQRRGANARAASHLGYVQVLHPLDLKST